MNAFIYRIFPLHEYFELNGVFLPSLDVYADDEESANRAAKILLANQDIGFVKLMHGLGNWKSKPYL